MRLGPSPPHLLSIFSASLALGSEPESSKQEVLNAIAGHVPAERLLEGTYRR